MAFKYSITLLKDFKSTGQRDGCDGVLVNECRQTPCEKTEEIINRSETARCTGMPISNWK